MSKILIELDTAEKELEVKVDGKSLADVSSVTICLDPYDDYELRCTLCTCSKSEDESLHYHNMISVAEEGKLVRSEKKTEGRENPFLDTHKVEIISDDFTGVADEIRAKLREMLS